MRLIDAETLAQEVASLRVTIAGRPAAWDEAKSDVLRVIDEQKTVGAAAEVCGHWVNPYINFYGHPCHCCSVCGFKASYQDKNYCPNCGAKMDGGDDNATD